MAGILGISGSSGFTVYAVIRNATAGDIWNGSTFESEVAGNWTTYDVALTEQSTTGFYKATFPSGITAGTYFITYHVQAGGSPAVTDLVFGQDKGTWDGSTWYTGLAFTSTHKTEISSQVLALLNTNSMTELSSIPDNEPTVFEALMLLYMWLRNNTTSTATVRTIRNNAGTAIGTSTMSDDGSTFQQGKLA